MLQYHLQVFCVDGITANVERCNELVEWSMAIVTPLATKIGYDKAAEIAYKAFSEKKTVKTVVSEMGLLVGEELESFFDPNNMI